MQSSPIQCPKCTTPQTSDRPPMETLKFAGIELDTCPSCNGCWLDSQEAGQLTRSRGANRVEIELQQLKPGELSCPRCRRTPMEVGQHIAVPGLFLDQCPSCKGVWLDRGELTTLLSHRSTSKEPPR